MTIRTSVIIPGPWAPAITPRQISTDQIVAQLKGHISKLANARDTITSTYTLFSDARDIWPDQCDQAVAAIRAMTEPVEALCNLLDTAMHLPHTIATQRYPLLVALHYVDDQARQTITLINLFRSLCRTSSKQALKHRHETYRKLETLLHGIDNILDEGSILHDQVRFQESNRHNE